MAQMKKTTGTHSRGAVFAIVGTLGFFGIALTLQAQEAAKKEPDKAVKPAVELGKEDPKGKIKPVVDDAKGPADVEALAAWQLRRKVVKAGVTLPSNVEDPIENGKVVPVVFRDFGKRKILGGSVFYVVLERLGSPTEGDTWASGIDRFDQMFVEGRGFDGRHSPILDTRARFLYLYQIVNDRGLRPVQSDDKGPKIKTIADDQKDTTTYNQPVEIASFSLRLLSDTRYITSWGYFHGQGLVRTIDVPNRFLAKDGAIPAAEGDMTTKTALAVSPFTSILQPLPAGMRYRPRSPSYPLTALMPTYGIGESTFNIGPNSKINVALQDREASLVAKLKGGAGVVPVVAGGQVQVIDNMLKVAQGAKVPDYVQLMYFGGYENLDEAAVAGIPEDEIAWGIFRADWKNQNVINHGQHSVVFGFTTDLPPVVEPLRIDDANSAMIDRGLRQFATGVTPAGFGAGVGVGAGLGVGGVVGAGAAVGPGVAPGVGAGVGVGGVVGAAAGVGDEGVGFAAATGSAPTPSAPPPAAAGGGALSSGGLFGTLGGQSGGGFGGSFGGGGGAIGTGRGGISGGGGGFSGGGSGGTSGNGTGSGNGNATTDTTARQAQAGLVSVNVNVTQANQQSQKMLQQQAQYQNQSQSQSNKRGNVIPAPASLLLALLGLPGLYYLRRRKQLSVAGC